MHGEATQRQEHLANLHPEWLPTWGGAGKLIATWPTALLRLAGSGAIVDESITLALGTDLHCYTPSQRWAYLSRPYTNNHVTSRKVAPDRHETIPLTTRVLRYGGTVSGAKSKDGWWYNTMPKRLKPICHE